MNDTVIKETNIAPLLPKAGNDIKLLKEPENKEDLRAKAESIKESLQLKRDFLELARGYVDIDSMKEKADDALKIIDEILKEA